MVRGNPYMMMENAYMAKGKAYMVRENTYIPRERKYVHGAAKRKHDEREDMYTTVRKKKTVHSNIKTRTQLKITYVHGERKCIHSEG